MHAPDTQQRTKHTQFLIMTTHTTTARGWPPPDYNTTSKTLVYSSSEKQACNHRPKKTP
ncbi:hypothetical protein CEPID_10260 [Corynebacterium epidermidicanis]|uniref:Uncharacterized protein n=1 Tax=Corynebacterium epidermidicanis TaxID=1050174 RepID=A0A0G3GR37_9CORY|nr:hypothetical protein CEPID_05910 [Corynebacterium epidermidicanis]AKK03888.1 hypothetical protein CEPID_10260 [Corynebacterium epidermidicanis]